VSDVDTALIAGGFALFGGFMGQYVYARRLARHTHLEAQLERLRQDRIQAYSDFAGALIEYRRTQLARWFLDHDRAAAEADVLRAREESRMRRASALDQYYRVTLLAGSQTVKDAAEKALDCTHAVHEAQTREAADALADRVRDELLHSFIEEGEKQVLVGSERRS
jgi:hypothetical protein